MSDVYVVDLGSRNIKFGIAKAGNAPSLTIPNVFSENGHFGFNATHSSWDALRYGNQRKSTNAEISFNADDFGVIVDALQDQSKAIWGEQPTIFGINYALGKPYYKKLIECFFEKTGAPALHLIPNTSAILMASGKTTGFSLDVGDVFTSTAAIFEGKIVAKGTIPNLGGRDVTNYLGELLNSDTINQESNSKEILYKIKEEHCFCALPNFEAAYQRKDKIEGLNVNVSVGNLGQQVSLNSQRFIAPEILFKPSLLGRDMNGVQYLVSDVISDVHISARKSILSSFTIGGGTSMLKGFPDRLKFELNFLNEEIFSNVGLTDISWDSRSNSAFLGLSVAAQENRDRFLSKQTFNEKGCSSYLNSLGIF